MTKLETLRKAAYEHKIVVITYKKKKDNRIAKYYIEPYSYRAPYVWGWDIRDKKIKSFIFSRIIQVKITSQEFEPDPLYKIDF